MDQEDYQFRNLVFRADLSSGTLSIRKDKPRIKSLDALFVFQIYGREGQLVHQVYLSHLDYCILKLSSAEEYKDVTNVMVYQYRWRLTIDIAALKDGSKVSAIYSLYSDLVRLWMKQLDPQLPVSSQVHGNSGLEGPRVGGNLKKETCLR